MLTIQSTIRILIAAAITAFLYSCGGKKEGAIPVQKDQHIVLIGNNLCSRMLNFGSFETEMHLRFPTDHLFIRNMCDGGDTPGFRPHSGRNDPWAFPGAEEFQTDLAQPSGSEGHLEKPDEWLTRLKADVIMAFFGASESFNGPERLDSFRGELDAFVKHTLAQTYNGVSSPRLVLVSPVAFEDLTDKFDLPDGKKENQNLELYSEAIREVAIANNVPYIDVFHPSKEWMAGSDDMTIDGYQLNEAGYEKLSTYLAENIYGGEVDESVDRIAVNEAVNEKNWFWHNDYKIPNGVHVFGRRYEPFGPDNYPAEIQKIREMTANRDTAIWAVANGETYDLAAADAKTSVLPEVETNYTQVDGTGSVEYLYGDDAVASLTPAPGYKIELFASEEEFPDLANPVQISFDNKGRMWVSVMPTYPHWKPGDPKPNDKILILEDTDNDGKADKQTVFADGLHLPVGFEIAPEGVYVSQGTNLKLLIDDDGDDHADRVEILLSGFDDHDTHHVISAFCADPSGAIYMAEGVFLHTNVETPYGPVRATNGGFYRYNPQRKRLERTAQLSIPNPWGIAFDDWGQPFFAETSGPDVLWMMPGTVKSRYGIATPKSRNLIEEGHRVRPTSGLEFVSSRHFPDDVQGDLLINNTIGFLGMKEHTMGDEGTGYKSSHRTDLITSTDKNFRPVDMEFAPDGSLYLIDWHNVLVGHMQHNARDPLRDHVHGRIYRITYPSRPLVEPAKIDGASIPQLLDNLKLPEYRTRYRTRRELRGRDQQEVSEAVKSWVSNLDPNDPQYEHNLLEALWVTWGIDRVNEDLLKTLLNAKDYHARAAAVRVLRYTGHQVSDQTALLKEAAKDPNGRVRLEAIVAASWLDKDSGLAVLETAAAMPLDDWMLPAYEASLAVFGVETNVIEEEKKIDVALEGDTLLAFNAGKEIYEREGFCITCHQPDGKGLPASGFPPLAGTKWVNQSEKTLIKIILKGLQGPIEVLGEEYPGQVPMTPYEGMLSNEEVAAVATYVRNSFGNTSSPVDAATVEAVRKEVSDRKGFYTPAELMQNEK